MKFLFTLTRKYFNDTGKMKTKKSKNIVIGLSFL